MNLFELFVKVGVDDQASGKLGEIGQKLGNGLKTAAKIGTAAVGAAAAGITALTTAAVNNYAEYEQLVGGVDTLFKDASQKVQQYAADAYKTAGMSANDYMANATAFSASLISSLGGDTEKAAEYANRAMVSMSDNANKMGTSLDSIVQTYQSLSRGNMAMLDNLKLGYGGTKSELQRLIKDAASYTNAQKKMGVTIDATSMSFDNIVNAIAVVQEEMGIAGATAEEAASTIEGSVASAKASWQNLVTGIADDNADFGALLDDFVESVGIAARNILPRIEIALNGASKLISAIIPKIVQAIPGIVATNLPVLLEASVGILKSMATGIDENKDLLLDTIFDTISYLAESFVDALPEALKMGVDLLQGVIEGATEAIPDIFSVAVKCVDELANTLTNAENLEKVLGSGGRLLFEIANGIIGSIPNLVDTAADVVTNLSDYIENDLNLEKMINSAIELLENLIVGLTDPTTLGKVGDAVFQFTDAVMKAISEVDWNAVGQDVTFAILKGMANVGDWLYRVAGEDLLIFLGALFGNPGMFVKDNSLLWQVSEAQGINTRRATLGDAIGAWEETIDPTSSTTTIGTKKFTSMGETRRSGNTTIVQNIYSAPSTAADTMEEAIYQAEKAVLQ